MGPQLVLTHGVGRGESSDMLQIWTRALAEGARKAGHGDLAASLPDGRGVRTAVAYYTDLFATKEAQGTAGLDLDPASAEILGELLLEIAESAADDGSDPAGQEALALARGQLAPVEGRQGPGDLARRLINVATTLLDLPGVRSTGQWLIGKAMILDLAQVARYLARGEPDAAGATLDQRVRARLRTHLEQGPAVVIGHSLGSIVAWETLHESAVDLPLFVTIGSPLGMRSAVLPRLRPQPLWTPEPVKRWLNFWDRDDILTGRPLLEEEFGRNSGRVRPVSARVDSDGLWVHPATNYLSQGDVAGPVAEALASGPR
ncbi:alpha/beta hydrolase [Dactylosporangium sp. NPDC049525]|uniref:alpha/beta hydrolase n=1 Tax=Dactylosporangium sp. NPDC049525 TaxID=3154730 RepID=UPI00342CD750